MTSIATKTRERLLDVARQLFMSNGVERTTMNDIATASDKGRRTIYTYFKNKKEIYDAVIERDAERIVERLREIVESDLGAEEKLRSYIAARFAIVDETLSSTSATSQIISYITLDYKRLERIRRLAVKKERELFVRMMEQGMEQEVFDPEAALQLPTLHQLIFQGVDICRLRDTYHELGIDAHTVCEDVTGFILGRLIRKDKTVSTT